MVLNDPLANVLSGMLNLEKVNKKEFTSKSNSKLIQKVLAIMQSQGYVGSAEIIDDRRGGILKVNLIGQINGCGVIKPRFQVSAEDIERFEKRFLPARGFGFLVISTNQGLMTNEEAKKKRIGGRLISYCY